MTLSKPRFPKRPLKRGVSLIVSATFLLSCVFPSPAFAQTILNLPAPGTMVQMSPGYKPACIRGMRIFVDNPLQFDFIVDRGDSGLKGDTLRDEGEKLIKYFMASLTVPEEELWVNLSPYEEGKIIAPSFGVTDMGRDLLAQDYILKQLTSSLMYPEDALGKKFWDRVYRKAQELYGTTEIPINTFNKIWIVPDKAVVFEQGDMAFIAESRLRVMLEEDYFSMMNNLGSKERGTDRLDEDEVQQLSTLSSEIVREILVPEIEKEVNEGRNFANLRQIYHSMILATWYKVNLKESLLGQVYADKNKIKGIDIADAQSKEKIYNRYLEAFKKGVYNYIREDVDPATQEVIPRKYFSGGFSPEADGIRFVQRIRTQRATNRAMLSTTGQTNMRLIERRVAAPQTPGDEEFVSIRSLMVENVGREQANIVQPPRQSRDRAMPTLKIGNADLLVIGKAEDLSENDLRRIERSFATRGIPIKQGDLIEIVEPVGGFKGSPIHRIDMPKAGITRFLVAADVAPVRLGKNELGKKQAPEAETSTGETLYKAYTDDSQKGRDTALGLRVSRQSSYAALTLPGEEIMLSVKFEDEKDTIINIPVLGLDNLPLEDKAADETRVNLIRYQLGNIEQVLDFAQLDFDPKIGGLIEVVDDDPEGNNTQVRYVQNKGKPGFVMIQVPRSVAMDVNKLNPNRPVRGVDPFAVPGAGWDAAMLSPEADAVMDQKGNVFTVTGDTSDYSYAKAIDLQRALESRDFVGRAGDIVELVSFGPDYTGPRVFSVEDDAGQRRWMVDRDLKPLPEPSFGRLPELRRGAIEFIKSADRDMVLGQISLLAMPGSNDVVENYSVVLPDDTEIPVLGLNMKLVEKEKKNGFLRLALGNIQEIMSQPAMQRYVDGAFVQIFPRPNETVEDVRRLLGEAGVQFADFEEVTVIDWGRGHYEVRVPARRVLGMTTVSKRELALPPRVIPAFASPRRSDRAMSSEDIAYTPASETVRATSTRRTADGRLMVRDFYGEEIPAKRLGGTGGLDIFTGGRENEIIQVRDATQGFGLTFDARHMNRFVAELGIAPGIIDEGVVTRGVQSEDVGRYQYLLTERIEGDTVSQLADFQGELTGSQKGLTMELIDALITRRVYNSRLISPDGEIRSVKIGRKYGEDPEFQKAYLDGEGIGFSQPFNGTAAELAQVFLEQIVIAKMPISEDARRLEQWDKKYGFIEDHLSRISAGDYDAAMMGNTANYPQADEWGYRDWPGFALHTADQPAPAYASAQRTIREAQQSFDQAMTSRPTGGNFFAAVSSGLAQILKRRFSGGFGARDIGSLQSEFFGKVATLPLSEQRSALRAYTGFIDRNRTQLRKSLGEDDFNALMQFRDGIQFGYYKGKGHFTSYPAEELLAVDYAKQVNNIGVRQTIEKLRREISVVRADDKNFMPRLRTAARTILESIMFNTGSGSVAEISDEVRAQVEAELTTYMYRALLERDAESGLGETRQVEASDMTPRDGPQSVKASNVSGYYTAGIVRESMKNRVVTRIEGGGGATVQVAMMKGRRTIAPIKTTFIDETGAEVTETPPESPFYNLYRQNLVMRETLETAIGSEMEGISEPDRQLLFDRYERKEDRKILFGHELDNLFARSQLSREVMDEIRRIYDVKQEILERGENGFGLADQPPENVDEGIRLMYAHGADVMRIFDATNDLENMTGAIESSIRVGARVQPSITYGPKVPNAIPQFVQMAQDLVDMFQGERAKYLDALVIKDVGGTLTPEKAYELVRGIREAGISVPLQLHTHDTSGDKILVVLEAIRANGEDAPIRIDTNLRPLAAPYAQPYMDTVARAIKGTKWEGTFRNYDENVIRESEDYLRSIIGEDVIVSTARRKAIVQAGMPGGMWTNFEVNVLENLVGRSMFLKEQFGVTVLDADRKLTAEGRRMYEALIDAVLEEQERVHEDVGYIPLGTPTSDWVGKQALNNVASWIEKSPAKAKDQAGNEIVVPDERRLVKYQDGKFIKLPSLTSRKRVEQYGPFWPGIQNFMMRRAQSRNLARLYPVVNTEVIRKAFGDEGVYVQLDADGLVASDGLQALEGLKPVLQKRFVDLPTIRLKKAMLSDIQTLPGVIAATESRLPAARAERARLSEQLQDTTAITAEIESLESKLADSRARLPALQEAVSTGDYTRSLVTHYAQNPALGIPLTLEEGRASKTEGQTDSREDVYLRVTQPAPNLALNLFAWRGRLAQLTEQTGNVSQREAYQLSLNSTGNIYDINDFRRSMRVADGKRRGPDRAMNATPHSIQGRSADGVFYAVRLIGDLQDFEKQDLDALEEKTASLSLPGFGSRDVFELVNAPDLGTSDIFRIQQVDRNDRVFYSWVIPKGIDVNPETSVILSDFTVGPQSEIKGITTDETVGKELVYRTSRPNGPELVRYAVMWQGREVPVFGLNTDVTDRTALMRTVGWQLENIREALEFSGFTEPLHEGSVIEIFPEQSDQVITLERSPGVHEVRLSSAVTLMGNQLSTDSQQRRISTSTVRRLPGLGLRSSDDDMDRAMMRDINDPLGGIDLNPALLDLQIKRDDRGVPLPLPQQPIQNMNIEGFLPVIINITPVTSLPLLSEADTAPDKVPELSLR